MADNRAVVVDPAAPGRLVIQSVPAPVPDRDEAIVTNSNVGNGDAAVASRVSAMGDAIVSRAHLQYEPCAQARQFYGLTMTEIARDCLRNAGQIHTGAPHDVVSRALMSKPKMLLMDEPSMGLAPVLVERSFEIIRQVNQAGVAMLVVEQNANVSLSIADRGYVLSTGRVVLEGKAADLLENEDLRKAYLGR